MKFAFLGYHVEQNWASMSKCEQDAMIDDCFTYDSKLMKEGHLLDAGAALQSSRTAKTLRWKNGAVLVTDGPFTETKEQLGGIGMLEARDMDHAVELMSKHPGLRYGSIFEIRPISEESLQRQASIAAKRSGTPPTNPQAAKFASLGYINESGWETMSKDEIDAMMKEVIAFDEARVQSGQWLSSIGLRGAGNAKTVRAKGGQVVVTDGPFVETKEQLAGIVVLAFPDEKDAIAVLSKHPALRIGVAIELRPIYEEIDKLWKAKVSR